MLAPVPARSHRHRLVGLVVAAVAVLAGAGCADDGTPAGAPSAATVTSPTPTGTDPTSVTTGGVTTIPAPTTVTASTDAPPVTPELPEITAVAELGYPRDLLERGRVNVVVARVGDEPFVLHDHQLRIDGFEPAAPEERRIVIPPNGQRVAIQGIFGEVVDCELDTPLTASLAVHYTTGSAASQQDGTIAAGVIELDDTAVLGAIQARFCTGRRILAENDIELGEPTVTDETVTLDLTITRRSGDAELTIDAIQGTVLFGVESPYAQGAPERTLAPGAAELVLPLTFDVNRCDPHAVAETTRKKGLTLWMAVDGAEAQPLDVDIAPIDGDLEEILDRCKARTGA
jgi:hypothetical protein